MPFHRLTVLVLDLREVVPDTDPRTDPQLKRRISTALDNLICRQVAALLHTADASVLLKHDSLGAPYLPDYPSLHISKSCCTRYGLCAISTDPVGVDAEPLHDPDYSVARRYYTASELDYIFGTSTPDRAAFQKARGCRRKQLQWTMLWTAKEAYCKFHGRSLSDLRAHSLSTIAVCALNQIRLHRLFLDRSVCCTIASRTTDMEMIRILGRPLLEQLQQEEA